MTIETIERTTFDHQQAQQFARKMSDVLNGAALGLMISIGHRTGLFDTMAQIPAAASSEQIARRAGLNERYVREWLGAMVTGGVVEYDPRHTAYRLPAEHAGHLTRAATPNNLAVGMQFFSVLGGVEDLVVEAFRHGRGVPYSAYRRFNEVMAEESGQTVVAALREHLLPLIPDVQRQLERGIEVLDVGCGSGLAMIELASMYPQSRFTGYDFLPEAIARARAEASRRGLGNVSFAALDVAELSEHQRFDLITAFDSIHDQARPADVLAAIHRALRPGGTFFMQDILASSHVHHNCDHPAGTFIYTISCMHCMSVSLAHGGPGLGAAWGKEKALEMLHDAGFNDVAVETLPHDPMNYYYVTKKPQR